MEKGLTSAYINLSKGWLFNLMITGTFLLIIFSIIFESYLLLMLTPLFALGYITIKSPALLFYILIFSIPFAVEFYLPNGFATDLPTEPLAVLGAGVFLILLLLNQGKILPGVWTNPIIIIVLFQLGWILFTLFFAEFKFIAFKYYLAKIWFTGAFLFLSLYILKGEKEIDIIFKILFYALIPAMLLTFVRNAIFGFDFEKVNRFMYPFFRNKVFYSSILLFSLPIGFHLLRFATSRIKSIFIVSIILLFVAGIASAYTRATLALIFVIPLITMILKLRLIKPAIILSFITLAYFIYTLSNDKKFVNYAPDYESTISHNEFGNLLNATTKGKDISTMERVHRWVAGYYMIQDRPVAGFGPNNFHDNYKSYTLNIFRTYVSDNKEKSGIHSYYLMIAVEQGIPGLIILLLLIILFFVRAENLYHALPDGKVKSQLLVVVQIFLLFTILQTINDMVEAYKVGVFYFLCIAILVRLETNYTLSATQLSENINGNIRFNN